MASPYEYVTFGMYGSDQNITFEIDKFYKIRDGRKVVISKIRKDFEYTLIGRYVGLQDIHIGPITLYWDKYGNYYGELSAITSDLDIISEWTEQDGLKPDVALASELKPQHNYIDDILNNIESLMKDLGQEVITVPKEIPTYEELHNKSILPPYGITVDASGLEPLTDHQLHINAHLDLMKDLINNIPNMGIKVCSIENKCNSRECRTCTPFLF